MAEPNDGYDGDDAGSQMTYIYQTDDGQHAGEYLTTPDGDQYLLVPSENMDTTPEGAQTEGVYQMTGDEYFQAVGIAQGSEADSINDRLHPVAVVTNSTSSSSLPSSSVAHQTNVSMALLQPNVGELSCTNTNTAKPMEIERLDEPPVLKPRITVSALPKNSLAGKSTIIVAPVSSSQGHTSTVRTVEQSDGTVTIVVTQSKVGTSPMKIIPPSKPLIPLSQKIVIMPSSGSGSAAGSAVKKVVTAAGSATLPVRFISPAQMSSLPMQTVTLPLKSTHPGLPMTRPIVLTATSPVLNASTHATINSSVVKTVNSPVVKRPVGRPPKDKSLTPVQPKLAPKTVNPAVTISNKMFNAVQTPSKSIMQVKVERSEARGTSTAEEEEEDEDVSFKQKGNVMTPQQAKERIAMTALSEETRKSNRRSTMSTKLAEWGLLPSSSAASMSDEDSDGEDMEDVPVIKSVARTYIKKTPVASPEPVNKQTTVHPLAAAQVVSLSSVGPKPPPRTYIKRIQDTPKANKVEMQNKSIMCKPIMMTKATSCNPIRISKATQTEEDFSTIGKIFVPVPVPILVPAPMSLYSVPTPVPLPIPVPVPIPCFIPTTRSSIAAIIQQLKELHDSMPSDPYEADILQMAEMVALADREEPDVPVMHQQTQVKLEGVKRTLGAPMGPLVMGNSSDMSIDMLEMALRLTDDPNMAMVHAPIHVSTVDSLPVSGKRGISDNSFMTGNNAKKSRLDFVGGQSIPGIISTCTVLDVPSPSLFPPSKSGGGGVIRRVPINDTEMKLKYSYGVNAWKQWVTLKNESVERASGGGGRVGGAKPRVRQFKSEILSCNSDELSFYLSLFVREVVKPTGENYAPDSLYYLCLGIQHYLYENGRIDNIFSDVYYSRFIESLNELLTGFQVKLNIHGQIVCRITEEHLWESRQLGAHSPNVLLSTLVYFNTKHFMLTSAETHLSLSFSNIMKQWKKNSIISDGRPARTVFLRYNTIAGGANSMQKAPSEIPFEQLENIDEPLRCPVKLYEFYLSKCPEAIKHRNDMFYLVPEPSCVPGSPVWYSAVSLSADTMTRMLNRINVVREIQEAQINQSPSYYG